MIFAELLDRQTEGNLAVAETLLSSGLIGVMFALLGGQPLLLLGITGPVALLLGTSYGLAEQFDAEYFPFFWWVCIWGALLHCLTAMVGLVNFVWTITPFTTQIFELFIAFTFIYQSIRDMVSPVHMAFGEAENRGSGYASLVIGVMTFYLCWTLHFADTWTYFTKGIRSFLEAYNMMIALVLATAFSYLPGVDQGNSTGEAGIERVNIRFTPWDWQPTADRKWLVHPLEGIDVTGIFAALFPALMLYLLFYIDHNVSAILTQHPKFNLKKPAAYHWDFFVLGLTIIPCGVMGLPPGNCLIPQGPLHTRALCTREFKKIHGVTREVVTYCEEQRWSGLGQALLMLVALSGMEVISWIPVGCLFGVFLYLGVGALHGNEIWERVTLMFIPAASRPPLPVVTETSSWGTVCMYTITQFVITATCFAVGQFTNIGYVFPVLIAALVPIRSYIISCFFSEEDLVYMDPPDGIFGVAEDLDEDDSEEEATNKAAATSDQNGTTGADDNLIVCNTDELELELSPKS